MKIMKNKKEKERKKREKVNCNGLLVCRSIILVDTEITNVEGDRDTTPPTGKKERPFKI